MDITDQYTKSQIITNVTKIAMGAALHKGVSTITNSLISPYFPANMGRLTRMSTAFTMYSVNVYITNKLYACMSAELDQVIDILVTAKVLLDEQGSDDIVEGTVEDE